MIAAEETMILPTVQICHAMLAAASGLSQLRRAFNSYRAPHAPGDFRVCYWFDIVDADAYISLLILSYTSAAYGKLPPFFPELYICVSESRLTIATTRAQDTPTFHHASAPIFHATTPAHSAHAEAFTTISTRGLPPPPGILA